MRHSFIAYGFTSILSTVLISLLGLSTASAADAYSDMPAGMYDLDKTHASFIWKVSHLGLSNYTARFTDFDASIDFNPGKPESSKITASVNPASLETDYPYYEEKDFDKKLIEDKKWFNATMFPEITFKSTKIERTGDSTGTMTGDLTFLGVTKPVSLNVTFNGAMKKQPFSKKPTLGFSAQGELKRSDWGFSTYVPNIGDSIELIIEAEFAMEEKAPM